MGEQIVEASRELDRITSAVILFYVSKLDGALGKTHLQKLLFLTDLLSSQKFKDRITQLEFVRYKHGPFSSQIDDYTVHLQEKGYLEIRNFPFKTDATKSYTRYYSGKPASVKNLLLKELGSEKVMLLDEVAGSFGNMSLQELLSFVYNLPVMKTAEMNEILDAAKSVESGEEESEEDFDF